MLLKKCKVTKSLNIVNESCNCNRWLNSNVNNKIIGIQILQNQKLVGKGELIFRNITKSDEGTYICRISDFEKSSSTHVDVSVGRKPIFISEEEEVIDFLENDSVPLICEATGDPEPEVIIQ